MPRLFAFFLIRLFALCWFNSFSWVLYSPLSVMSSTDFFLFCGLSYFLVSVFQRAENLILRKCSLSLISFMDCALDFISNESLLYPKSYGFPSLLSSRNFIILCFSFRSVIGFKFCYRCKVYAYIHLLHVYVPLFKHICWKDNFALLLSLLLCQSFKFCWSWYI